MSQLDGARKIQKEAARLVTTLEALEGFQGSDGDRAAFERQVRSVKLALAEAVAAVGARKSSRVYKVSAVTKTWRSAHMKLLSAVLKSTGAEKAAAQAALDAWKAANPTPSKAAKA